MQGRLQVPPDPMLQQLPGILSHESRMQALKNSGGSFDSVMKQFLSTGPFAEADKRQAAWGPQVAQMSNANAQMQSDAMLSGNALPTNAASAAHNQVNQQLPGESTVGAGTYKKQDLNALRGEQATQDAKNAAEAKDASRLQRNKLMGLPLNTP